MHISEVFPKTGGEFAQMDEALKRACGSISWDGASCFWINCGWGLMRTDDVARIILARKPEEREPLCRKLHKVYQKSNEALSKASFFVRMLKIVLGIFSPNFEKRVEEEARKPVRVPVDVWVPGSV